MEHGNPFGNAWFAFGGSVGGGGIGPNAVDLPPVNGGVFSLETGWGSGGVPGYFGGFGRTNPVDLTGTTHFNFWINPDGIDGIGGNQDYTIEINLQDDDNGDNTITQDDDDEFQYNLLVGPEGSEVVSGGGWQFVSIPFTNFFDDNSYLFGGNGILDATAASNGGNGQLINVVFAIISNNGADATFRTDYWIFSNDPPAPEELIEVVITSVDESEIHKGTKESLWTSLKNALKSLAKGNTDAAINQLQAFINKVEAQSGKKIDEATADKWIADVQGIIDAIETSLEKNSNGEELTFNDVKLENYSLNQNYPNPFNPTTSISYSIPSDSRVTLAIYDVLGNEVARLENGYKSAGTYSYSFDASNLSSGMYFYTITAGNFSSTKKMLLMK